MFYNRGDCIILSGMLELTNNHILSWEKYFFSSKLARHKYNVPRVSIQQPENTSPCTQGSHIWSSSPPVCQMKLSHGPIIRDVSNQEHCQFSPRVLLYIKPHNNKPRQSSTSYYHSKATKSFLIALQTLWFACR